MLGLITLALFAGYILVAYFIVKVQKSKRKKIIAATIMILIPTWDVIIGRTIFYSLCATQGGIHVYQTVELGPEYFDEDGIPLFFDRKKSLKEMSLNKYIGLNNYSYRSKFFNVKKDVDMIIDKENKEIKGDMAYFIFFGGWVFNSLNTGGAGGERCPSDKLPSKYIIDLSEEVFIRNKL